MRAKKLNWKLILIIGFACFGTGLAVEYFLGSGVQTITKTKLVEVSRPVAEPQEIPSETTYPYLLAPGSTLSSTLRKLNVSAKTVDEITKTSKPVADLGRLRAGTRFRLVRLTDPSSELIGIEFLISPIEKIAVNKRAGAWKTERIVETVKTKVVSFKGEVNGSLWSSATQAKMDTILIQQLTEIFGWQVDFARQVKVHDRWRLTVEQKLVNGKPIGWGSILAAEYRNGKSVYNAVLYQVDKDRSGYFTSEGSSLRRLFLKSPLRYARVTSGFTSKRFHPLEKKMKAHLGVDYGAPSGTPIRVVGDGSITFLGKRGGGGNTIRIKHGTRFQTVYMHMSRFEPGLHSGSSVKQGQVIGYVGMTGLATGPHLHFEFHQDGKVLDPLSAKFPSADPVPTHRLADFKSHAAVALEHLPQWDRQVASTARK